MTSYRMKYYIGNTQYSLPVADDIANLGGGGGIPVGMILPYSANSVYPPEGFLWCDGSAVSRSMYPDLFLAIGTTYGEGDGVSTFNLPNLVGGEFLEGSGTAGTEKSAGLPNIEGQVVTGAVYSVNSAYTGSGPFSTETVGGSGMGSGGQKNVLTKFNASSANPIYGNSQTVQPKSVTVKYVIKSFDSQSSSSALVDITSYASELNQRYDVRSDMTIIYPNNGTVANPANVTKDSRYAMSNPFPGYLVYCVAEVLAEGHWGAACWFSEYVSGSKAYGTLAHQLDDDSIIVQTGTNAVAITGHLSGTPNPGVSQNASLPCRVKVWKIGKIPQSNS